MATFKRCDVCNSELNSKNTIPDELTIVVESKPTSLFASSELAGYLKNIGGSMTYLLSEYGKKLTWGTWESIGGCGLSGSSFANVSKTLGPRAHWDPATLTLGEIQEACIVAGREMARFSKEHLKMDAFWVQEKR